MKLNALAIPAIFLAGAVAPTAALAAVDAGAFADRLSEMFTQVEFVVTFDDVRSEGDDIILSGINAAPKDETLVDFDAELVFTNVQMDEDGSYTADSGVIAHFGFEKDDVVLSAEQLSWEHVFIPGPDLDDPMVGVFRPARYSAGPINVSIEGEDVFRIESIGSSAVPRSDQTETYYSYDVEGIFADLGKILDDRDAVETLEEFGLLQINARMRGENRWVADSGSMEISESSVEVDNVGKFDFTAGILGYDAEFIRSLYELQQQATEGDELNEDFVFAQMQLMADRLFLTGAGFRFDDDGITNKLLDFAAEEQGMPRAAMLIGFSAALPIMLSELGVAESLQTAALQATTIFMTEPRSLEVRVDPAKPLRFSRLAAAVEDEDAAALVTMLNPTVTANQD